MVIYLNAAPDDQVPIKFTVVRTNLEYEFID